MLQPTESSVHWAIWPARAALAAGVLMLLVSGIWAGLLRLGWDLPAPHSNLALLHGPLFVCGVLGTIIGLERAVALARPWAFGGPLLTVLGGLVLLAGAPAHIGALFMVGGSLGLLAVFAAIIRRQPARFTITMALGAAAWLGGNLLWLNGGLLAPASFWWAGFLILTIAGERLELGRLRQLPSRVLWAFSYGVAILLTALLIVTISMEIGTRLAGFSFVLLGVWLLRYDVARRTIRRPGLPRFSAVCILSGSLWLTIGGGIALIAGAIYAGPIYDAVLHAVFVGFVFAMIFGHAPIVIPALLNLRLPFHVWNYLPLAALHLSLIVRLAGDLAGLGDLRRWGGMLNGVTILLFLVLTAAGVWRGRQAARMPLVEAV